MQSDKTMNGLFKNLGLLFVVAGVITLIVSAFSQHINNAILGGALTTIIVGLFVYILLNKQRKY